MPKAIKVGVITQAEGAHLPDYFLSLAKAEERRCRQALLVEEIAQRVAGPPVAHRHRLVNLIAPDDDRVAFDLGLGGVELLVRAGDGEADERHGASAGGRLGTPGSAARAVLVLARLGRF